MQNGAMSEARVIGATGIAAEILEIAIGEEGVRGWAGALARSFIRASIDSRWGPVRASHSACHLAILVDFDELHVDLDLLS